MKKSELVSYALLIGVPVYMVEGRNLFELRNLVRDREVYNSRNKFRW